MKHDLYQVFETAIGENALKLSGISCLLKKYHSDGTYDRDNEDMQGLGLLIQSLSDEGSRIRDLMNRANSLPMDTQVEIERYDWDVIGVAEKVVEKLLVRGKPGNLDQVCARLTEELLAASK